MVSTMDTREAVICIDAYSDSLVSLSLLVENGKLQDHSDSTVRNFHARLTAKLVEKQNEAMQLVAAVVTEKDRWPAGAVSQANIHGLQEAVARYVLADRDARNALKPPQESAYEIFSRGMEKIHEGVAAREQAAKEAKAEAAKAKVAKPATDAAPTSSVSPAAVNDAAAGNPELPSNP